MRNEKPEDQLARNRNLRRLNFVALLITFALVAARTAVVPEDAPAGPADLLYSLLMGLFSSAWCLFDGRMRDKAPASVALLVIFIIWPIALPAYIVWSRGLRGLLLALGFLALLIITFVAVDLILALVLDQPIFQ